MKEIRNQMKIPNILWLAKRMRNNCGQRGVGVGVLLLGHASLVVHLPAGDLAARRDVFLVSLRHGCRL